MVSEHGDNFVKALATFIRSHEKALASTLLLTRPSLVRQSLPATASAANSLRDYEAGNTQAKSVSTSSVVSSVSTAKPSSSTSWILSTPTNALLSVLTMGAIPFPVRTIQPVKLTMTPHHLYYLLLQMEYLEIEVGPMTLCLQRARSDTNAGNYISFLNTNPRPQSDKDSVHSVSSLRSLVSGIRNFWGGADLHTAPIFQSTAKVKAQTHLESDIKYLYSAFTKLPCLRLTPNFRTSLIAGYEEFPFESAVPLVAFKNLTVLEVIDTDFRRFYGWDTLAEQLRSLVVKRACLDDVFDLIITVLLGDAERRRRHSSGMTVPPASPGPTTYNSKRTAGRPRRNSRMKLSFDSFDDSVVLNGTDDVSHRPRSSQSGYSSSIEQGHRRSSSALDTLGATRSDQYFRHSQLSSSKMRRSTSMSSTASVPYPTLPARDNYGNSLFASAYPLSAAKWRYLRHLSVADNSLSLLSIDAMAPLADSLESLDISCNLFTEIPEALKQLRALRALNISYCMLQDLRSARNITPPGINAVNFRNNRISDIIGVEQFVNVERIDLRNNLINQVEDLSALSSLSHLQMIWVSRNPLIKTSPNHRDVLFEYMALTAHPYIDVRIDGVAPTTQIRHRIREKILLN